MDFIFDYSPENSDEIDSDVESALYSQLHYSVGDNNEINNNIITKEPPVKKKDTAKSILKDCKDEKRKNRKDEERTILDIEPTDDKFEVLLDFLKNSKNSLLNGCVEPQPENDVIDLTKTETESECSEIEKWQIIESETDSICEEKSLKLHVVEAVEVQNKDDNNWSVIDQDMQDLTGREGTSRYFVNSRIRCKNCDEAGHVVATCPMPRKQKVCHLCAQEGHLGRTCPKHVNLPYRHHDIECRRCNRCGHIQSECPELWRQYHLTVASGHIVTKEVDQYKSKKKSCFSCKKKSHFAFDCPKYNTWHPYSMFISRYDHWMYIPKPNNPNEQIIPESEKSRDLKSIRTKNKNKCIKRKEDNKSNFKLPEKKKMKVSKEIQIATNRKHNTEKNRNNSKVSYKNTKLEITVINNQNKMNSVKPGVVKKQKKTVKPMSNGNANVKNRKRKVEYNMENENQRNVIYVKNKGKKRIKSKKD